MSNFVLDLIGNFGYFGMFIGMVLEAVIIAIPSELILATGGILASKGIFTFWGAFLIGLLGSVFCAIVIYFMGYFGGRTFIKKYGKYFFMKEEDIEKSDSWFNKYGMLNSYISSYRYYKTTVYKIFNIYHNRIYSMDISLCICWLFLRRKLDNTKYLCRIYENTDKNNINSISIILYLQKDKIKI